MIGNIKEKCKDIINETYTNKLDLIYKILNNISMYFIHIKLIIILYNTSIYLKILLQKI